MLEAPEKIIFVEEVADFLADRPSPEQILAYRPSNAVQGRFTELLEKKRNGELTANEEEELSEFQQTEILLRLIKAKLRSAPRP
ncbi:MAG: hypothetical protein O3B01_05455 [Planctomycetota bacterium]|nr:hypothetical protein [Planctomycetota bacterium]MDA1138008.1 hypothetical protein [Planctomycetota bacterium]